MNRANHYTVAPNADSEQPRVLWIGKRHYTNRDALKERYGRIYRIPSHWANSGLNTTLWLIDYYSRKTARSSDGSLEITSLHPMSPKFFKSAVTLLARPHSYTHVIASGDCYVGLFGYAVARRSKAKFVFDIYDKYDDFSGYRRIPKFDPFSFLLKYADRCMFASHSLMNELGQPNRKDFIVRNGIDTERFIPSDMHKCRRDLNLPDNKIFVGYFGSMEADRGVQDLITAITQLRKDTPNLELLIGGKSSSEVDLSAPGIRYVGNIPFSQMPTILSACNLLAVPYRRSSVMDAGASNKIAEAVAVSRPIIATKTPNLIANFAETARALKDRLAEPGNIEEIAQAIRIQLANPVLSPMPLGWDWPSIAQNAAVQLGLMSLLGEDHS